MRLSSEIHVSNVKKKKNVRHSGIFPQFESNSTVRVN